MPLDEPLWPKKRKACFKDQAPVSCFGKDEKEHRKAFGKARRNKVLMY